MRLPSRLLLLPAVVVLVVPELACVERASTFVAPREITPCEGAPPTATGLRAVTWNIRAGLSSSIETIGDVLEALGPDVIALQEVDRLAERTGSVDQAAVLADRLGMDFAFAGARKEGSGQFGVALLSRFPFARAERIDLPGNAAFEPRVAVDASVCVAGSPVRAVSVHADIYPWAAEENATALADAMDPSLGEGVIVAGDLNATPDDKPPAAFTTRGLVDAIAGKADAPTFADRRIDYVFVDDALAPHVDDAEVDDVDASDHRPMYVDLTVPGTPDAS